MRDEQPCGGRELTVMGAVVVHALGVHAVAGIGDVVSAVGGVFGQALEILSDPFRWLYHHTLGAPLPQRPGDPGWGACQSDWTQPACPKVLDALRPQNLTLDQTWPRLYGGFAVSGVVVALTACVMRVVRATFDERVTGVHLVTDAVTRAVVAVGVLALPSPGSSLLLNAIRLCASASTAVASGIAGAVGGAFGGRVDVGSAVAAIASTAFESGVAGDFLVAIPVLLAALGFMYILALFLVRVVQLVFAVASAPLFVAVAAYDTRNRFVQWWVDLFTSAMLLPLVLAFCGSLTGCVALFFLGGASSAAAPGGVGVVRSLLACFTLVGGVWMTGKAAHGLAWRSFTHGGFTGAVTAVSTAVMAVPQVTLDATQLARRAGAAFAGRGGGAGGAGISSAGSSAIAGALAGRGGMSRGGGPAVAAAMEAARATDFSRFAGVGRVVPDGAARDAFNDVIGACIATAGSDDPDGMSPDKAALLTRAVGADASLAPRVAAETVASLLHGSAPDLSPLLGRVLTATT